MEDDQQTEGSPEGDSGLPSECVLLSKACDMGSTVHGLHPEQCGTLHPDHSEAAGLIGQ